VARPPHSHPRTKGSIPERREVGIETTQQEDFRLPIARAAIVIIISERIANFVIILISMREANGVVACPIVLCVSGRRTRKRLSLYGPREQMEPYCLEDYQMQSILLHPLARMIMMMEIKDDDVTITVEIVMVIEEIKEVVEVVVVVDKSNSLETQVRPVSLVVSLT
jgi:hypothetical protein